MAVLRNVTPGFFDTVGVAILAGRDFTADDPRKGERVAIINKSLADRVFPNGDAVNRWVQWPDRMFGRNQMRVVGVVEDVYDERRGEATPAIYHPVRQMPMAGRLFVRTSADPQMVIPAVARTIREISADQPVERAATLQEIHAEVLTPERLNAFVVGGFAGVALLIAVVGVAGVLAFSVTARTREFGVRLAVGSTPRGLLTTVLGEGLAIVGVGIAIGSSIGFALTRLASSYVGGLPLAGLWPMTAAAAVMAAAALVAALLPASRASRVDVLQALRTE
jgi:hypothetical protein